MPAIKTKVKGNMEKLKNKLIKNLKGNRKFL